MANKTAVAIDSFACFHGSGRGSQILEQGDVPILVDHSVALEDNAVFVFAARIASWKLGSLFRADSEKPSHVSLLTTGTSLSCNVIPFAHDVFVPYVLFT
jgi:hypothetical protein